MKVNHPHLKDIQRDVPDEDIDRWIASGWIPDLIETVDDQTSWDSANAEFKAKPPRNSRK